jgi:hypothetical protein
MNILRGYGLLTKWEVLTGGAIEFEKEKNLTLFEVGTGYEFSLKDDWAISPSFL